VLWCAFGIALAALLAAEYLLERFESRPAIMPPWSRTVMLDDADDAVREEFAREEKMLAAREQSGLPTAWEPFVYWRGEPFSGKYINIDQQGRRATWNPPPSGADRPRVFFFGGSAMWGAGSRDDHTIPSLVTKNLFDHGYAVESINCAQKAYVSTQEVIALMRELQAGNVPDLVIFLDGFNDVCSSEVNEAAGCTLLERERFAEFRMVREPALSLLGRALHGMAVGRWASGNRGWVPVSGKWESSDAMVRATMNVYVSNVRIVESVKKSYGFDAIYCWQPVLYEKRSLSPYERNALTGYQKIQDACHLAWQSARRLSEESRRADVKDAPRLCYLGDVFNWPEWDGKTAFIDRCHLTEKANAAVAREIAAEAQNVLKRRQTAAEPRAAL
jgi:lysophospholipase L1-like esterase